MECVYLGNGSTYNSRHEVDVLIDQSIAIEVRVLRSRFASVLRPAKL